MNGKLTYFTSPPIVDEDEDLDDVHNQGDVGMAEADSNQDEEEDDDDDDDDD